MIKTFYSMTVPKHGKPSPTQEWRFAEFFAGQAAVSEQLRLSSYRGVSFDITYGGKGMDLLTASGMGFPD